MLLPFLLEDLLQEFTQPTGRKPVSTFWSRATARYWWWRMGDSLTRYGRSETSYPISRRYVYFMIYCLSQTQFFTPITGSSVQRGTNPPWCAELGRLAEQGQGSGGGDIDGQTEADRDQPVQHPRLHLRHNWEPQGRDAGCAIMWVGWLSQTVLEQNLPLS